MRCRFWEKQYVVVPILHSILLKRRSSLFAIYDEENPTNTHKHNLYWRQKIQYALVMMVLFRIFKKLSIFITLILNNECLMRLYDEESHLSLFLFRYSQRDKIRTMNSFRIMMQKSFEAMSQNTYDFSL